MCTNYLFLLFGFLSFASLNDAQDQSGFISIDCGIPDKSRYTDETTGINYVSDVDCIDTGVSKSISTLYKTNGLEQQFHNVRSFPEGTKNCYTLTPPQIVNHTRYFVRARFMYGNYDDKNEAPKFDIYLGVDYWATVDSVNQTTIVSKEALYVPSSDYTYVCLVNTGNGTPFLSVLELRLVENGMYISPSGSSFELQGRYDMRSYDNTAIIRFKDDIIDRIWEPPFFLDNVVELNTSQSIIQNDFTLPPAVMRTAITMQNANQSLEFSFRSLDPNTQYYFCLHFADFQSSQIREFNISINDDIWYGPLKTEDLSANTIYSTRTLTEATWFNFSLHKTFNSELPPILNALEIYTAKDFLNPLTNQQDVAVIKSIKSEYRIKSNWQGDPCAPANYSWLGLSCFNDRANIPRINSLNLSSNGLSGTISSSIVNLSMIQSLDLSNNNLIGEVPGFLTQMQKLSVLNLSGNNLSGTIPEELAEKARRGSLSLSIGGNPYLCTLDSCNATNPVKNKKKSSMAAPIIASIAGALVVIIALSIIFLFCILKRRKSQPKHGGATVEIVTRDVSFQAKQRQFSYSEVKKITRNFERVLGKGGFGSVFHGYIDNNQVAVKMLSPSSAQGYKQFKAEAELLMRVHHRNLTTFIGYCYEGDKLGLIYEYMANGDLQTQLSDSNRKALSWYLRIQIVLDAAQGLEYLHTGCKPPIIHRDVKTTNILLNEEWQAKLADFGLSKAFPTEGGSHVSTAFAGTPGYFDPEYNLNEKTDVFSFGVVLLEIITGKPPISKDQERTHLSKWVADTLEKKGNIRDVVDPRLGNKFDLNSVWKAVDVAMQCVSPASIQRPTMNHVVMDLRMCLEMEKAKMNKFYQSEYDNDPETEYSNLDIGITDVPMAR